MGSSRRGDVCFSYGPRADFFFIFMIGPTLKPGAGLIHNTKGPYHHVGPSLRSIRPYMLLMPLAHSSIVEI